MFNLQNVSIKIWRTFYGNCFWRLTSTISFNVPKSKGVVTYFTFFVSFAYCFPKTRKNASVFTNVSNEFQNLLAFVPRIYLSWQSFPFMLWILSLYYLAFWMVKKLKKFGCLRSYMVDFPVTLNEVLGKSKKLGCLQNTDFDLCWIVYSSSFFVINIIKLDLEWKNYQHYWHSEEHLSRGCIRKAHKSCSCWIVW